MGKKFCLISTLILLSVFLISFSSWAVPVLIDYQGILTDPNGIALEGDYDMKFEIFDDETGGVAVWSEQQTVSVIDGIYNVQLGAVVSLSEELFDNEELYLELTISSETLSPRKRLNSTAYSMKASDADTLGGEDPSYYAEASHTHSLAELSGQVSDDQVPDDITIDNASSAGFASTAGDADTVDGKHASELLDTSSNTQTKSGGLNIDGNVGIGTQSPSEKLEVAGTIKSASGGFRFPDGTIQSTASSGDGHSLDAADGNPSDVLYVDPDGKVGIGTTTPQSLLNIDSGGNSAVVIRGDANRSSAGSVLLALQGYWNGTRVAGFDLQTGEDTVNKDAGRIKFRTAADASTGLKDRLVIDENGNVGIGTASPQSLLDIDSGGNIPIVIKGNAARSGAGNVLLALQAYWNGTRVAGFDLQTGEDTVNKDAGRIKFRTAADASTGLQDRLVIDENGNIGIGTTSPNFTLQVNGSAGKPGGGSWSDASDIRLKKNITNLTGALDKLLQLQGVTFEWINPNEHGNNSNTQAGLIAQEVENIFPQWVYETTPTGKDKELVAEGDTIKTLQFPHGFNAYIIEAVKELKSEIDELKAENAALKAQIDALTE